LLGEAEARLEVAGVESAAIVDILESLKKKW